MKIQTYFIVSLIYLITTQVVLSKPLQPVVLATKGESSIQFGNNEQKGIQLKEAIPAGATITTGGEGRLALAIAPGQMVVLQKDTQLKIVSLHDSADLNGAVIELISGSVSCEIDPNKGKDNPSFKLKVGDEVVQAQGTGFQVSKTGGTIQVVVLSSVVTFTSSTGQVSLVNAGMVFVMTFSPTGSPTGGLIVNLLTGRGVVLSPTGEPTEAALTNAQLGFAAAAFQSAAAFAPVITPGFGTMVTQINATLSDSGVASLSNVQITNTFNTRDTTTVSSNSP